MDDLNAGKDGQQAEATRQRGGKACEHDLGEIWTWNATVPETVERCVHELIGDMVQQQPDALAICAWDGELTYRQLDDQSTQLAHHLVALGVGPDTVVPLCFEKSKWTPVAMLGVMKAGGASIALDSTQPEQRLRTIVEQVLQVQVQGPGQGQGQGQGQGPVMIILSSVANEERAVRLTTTARNRIPSANTSNININININLNTTNTSTSITTRTTTTVVVPETLLRRLQIQTSRTSTSINNPPNNLLNNPPPTTLPTVSPSSTLCLVFTSGSTGTPKGAILTHTNFSSAIWHQRRALGISARTRVYDFASYTFDIAWLNALHSLTAGACMCIPSQDERRDDLAGSIHRLQANWAFLTPSTIRVIEPSQTPLLQHIALGGEPPLEEDVACWKSVSTLLNAYGPAECTMVSTVHAIDVSLEGDPPMGYGVGLRTWVVEPESGHFLLAIGSVGELWLEGPTVSQGYLSNPEKTAAAFVQDPPWLLRGGPGCPGRRGRLYKTGDLVRYNPDGSLQYVGRKDAQVKIRGQRVELSDVEHHVRACLNADVQVISEMITPRGSRNTVLAAFVSIRKESGRADDKAVTSLAFEKLLVGLEERLGDVVPVYMIPTFFIPIPMDQIPITGTGKTDRGRLREIGGAMSIEQLLAARNVSRPRGPKRLPATEMERRLHELWASVLAVDTSSIDADDSFLLVGGDSIAAMRLVAAARAQGLSLTVADIFTQPRLYQLAEVVKETLELSDENLPPRPLSLLSAGDLAELSQRYSNGQIHGTIEDVLPTTDFQGLAIQDALLDPPSRWHHIILNLPSDTDFERLEWACSKLTKSFDILRTVFIEMGGKYWQVVFRNMEPRFDLFQTHGDVQLFTIATCEEDLRNKRELGTTFVRFIAIKDSRGEHKLIFRLSHAQFDGYSQRILFRRLGSIYTGDDDACEPPSYRQLIAYNNSRVSQGLLYWKSRLQNSPTPDWNNGLSMDTTYSPADRLIMECKITLPKPYHGVSISTLFHAACAIAFSRQLNRSDVVFGRLVTGRLMLPPSLQAVVGPCLVEIPVWVSISEGDTLIDVATSLQKQFIEDSSFESVGMDEILRHCTDWPPEVVDFGWRTSFQQEPDPTTMFSGNTYTYSHYKRDMLPRMRPEIYAKPRRGELELYFSGNSRLIDRDTVKVFLQTLQVLLGEC